MMWQTYVYAIVLVEFGRSAVGVTSERRGWGLPDAEHSQLQ